MKMTINESWSEEDERCLENAIMYCEWARDKAPDLYCYETSEKSINFLKSFKVRVQPKQEWSEEDNAMLISIENILIGRGHSFHDKEINWLKSLKNRYTWKPSDEQIKVCKEVYADILSAKCFDLGTVNSELNRMEEQLKKLREE